MVSRDPSPGRQRPRNAGRRRHDAKPAVGYLSGTAIGAAWEQLSALARDLGQIQPSLSVTPLKLDKGILIVSAHNAGMAARLRQFEPRLVRGLQARGWRVERIRFRPTAIHDGPRPPPPRVKTPVSDDVVARVAQLATEDLPDSLRRAVEAFVRRQRSYRQAGDGEP